MIERITDKRKFCKYCLGYGHTQWKCPQKPRQPLKAKTGFAKTKTVTLKTKKPMNKTGKVQKRTAAAVAKWKRTQTPSHQGYYFCFYCGKPTQYLMAEHYQSKARSPHLRTDENNLVPTCAECNKSKGSKNGKDFIQP